MNSSAGRPRNTQTLGLGNASPTPANAPSQSAVRSAAQTAEARKEVFFELDASSAKEVLLAGDFTNWEKTPIKLRKGEHGAWYTTVMLAPGQYHYKFVVDGQWKADPCAAENSPNPFGTSDSVLEIS